ncbi:hypothetical protein GCM10009535_02120 [Streptomyces thermocarboxydovorans]|uniref:Radical SAM domain protein n=1 Tax=Streptomyces thermocarboxydovorans TaxID=59298 RepID=A0ABP3SAK5_9ACTN
MRTLAEHGIGCGVLMAPVIPFLSDRPEQLRSTVRAIAASGATSVTPLVLHLRPGAREWFMAWLSRHHPYLVGRYERLYADGAYAPKWYQRRITRQEYGTGPTRTGLPRRTAAVAPAPARGRRADPAHPALRRLTLPRGPPRAFERIRRSKGVKKSSGMFVRGPFPGTIRRGP